NLVDIYHLPILHRGTFGKFIKPNDNDDSAVKLLPRGGWAYSQKARPHSKTGERVFPVLPWLEGESEETSFRAGIFPNLILSMRIDSLRMWQVWPISADQTQLHIYLMFPEKAKLIEDFDSKLTDYKSFI